MKAPTATETGAILRELLEAQPKGGQRLPPLKAEELGVSRWLSDLWDKFIHWVNQFFPSWSGPKQSVDLLPLIQLIGWWLLAALIAITLYFVIKGLLSARYRRRTPARVKTSSPSAADPELEGMVAGFLAKGEFAAAMRWRWRLALVRLALPKDRTPVEVDGPALQGHYPAMYGYDQATAAHFQAFDGALKQRESGAGASR